MEQLSGVQGRLGVSPQSHQELGMQLRCAAERGKLSEVRKLLSCGAPAVKDTVSCLVACARDVVLSIKSSLANLYIASFWISSPFLHNVQLISSYLHQIY